MPAPWIDGRQRSGVHFTIGMPSFSACEQVYHVPLPPGNATTRSGLPSTGRDIPVAATARRSAKRSVLPADCGPAATSNLGYIDLASAPVAAPPDVQTTPSYIPESVTPCVIYSITT